MTSDEPLSQAISVLLVEDDAPTSWRLQDALARAGYQVRAAATLAEARTALAQGAPKVLLTDLQLPDGHGIDLIRETRARAPDTEIMVISILGDEESVISAITVGAHGYLLKDAFPTDIAATVRDLVAGHSPISASIARFIVRRTQNNPEPPPGPALNTAKLTPREIDILWGIAKGFSYAEIAGHLGLSRQTVPGHIKSIYRKLEVHTRGEAVFEAVQQGLIPAVNEDAATAIPPGEARRRLQLSRLLQYLLLQVLIAIVCGFILRQPLPAPPENYAVTEFRLREGASERAVTLPHFSSARSPADDQPVYSGQFTYPKEQTPRAWSIYLPRFTNAAEVAVNGIVVLDTRRDPAANRPDRSTPQIAVIPTALLHDGSNELSIRLFVWGPISAFLDAPYVGPDEIIRPYYDQRALLFVTLPIVFSAWQAILAVILSIMWVMRRHEPAYGMLAAAMAVGVLQAFLSTPIDNSRYAAFNAVAIASAPLESGLVLAFAILFFGRRWPRWGALIFAPAAILIITGLVGGQASVRALYLFIGTPTVGICLIVIAFIAGNAVLRRQDVASLLLGCAVTIVLTSWVNDMLSVLQILPDRRIFFSRLTYSAMLVAIGAALTWRFARALNQVDSFAGRLVTQVREAEDKLKASFAREQERERTAALARERTRLMRDLHDGLGGQLVSIVALSERGNDASAGIGDAARAALKDLRLVIDSMDDIGGDLMLALGSWRERALAQLRPHDIALDWQITPPGLPVHPELRPWHVIQIMRLLDEALTNAVKHAHAQRITVRIETLADASGLDQGCITIADDGKGFALTPDGQAPQCEASAGNAKTGRGLRNMKSRAARCGAGLELTSGAGGTRVRLILPHRFPDSDANA